MPGEARIGDKHEGICSHGAPCCPHKVSGTIITGSPDVIANGVGVARLGDLAIHNCPHCGKGIIVTASLSVTANGMGIARLGDLVEYPGGIGVIITTSGDVLAG